MNGLWRNLEVISPRKNLARTIQHHRSQEPAPALKDGIRLGGLVMKLTIAAAARNRIRHDSCVRGAVGGGALVVGWSVGSILLHGPSRVGP